MALDLSKLGDPDIYKNRVDEMIDEIKASKKAEGVDTIYYPGEIEMGKMKTCMQNGYMEGADDTMASIAELEAELGIR